MSYSDFKNGLTTFHEYIAPENQNIPIATPFDGSVVRVELGVNPKQMLCDLLAGKFPPKLPQIQLCLDMNLGALESVASANAALVGAIQGCRAALQGFNEHTGLPSTLARVNAVIGEAAAVASMIAFCSDPINPKPIPNLLETIMGSFLGAGEAIMNKLGKVMGGGQTVCMDFSTNPPSINHNIYIPGGLLDDIWKAIESGMSWGPLVDDWINQFNAIRDEFYSLIEKENAIAEAAIEAGGVGGSNEIPTLADANPVVQTSTPVKEGEATPIVTSVKNPYGGCFIGGIVYPDNHDPRFQSKSDCENTNVGGTWIKSGDTNPQFLAGGYTGNVYTLDVALKFTEKMNPNTIVVRKKTDHSGTVGNNLGTGFWGSVRLLSPNGKECLWAGQMQRQDSQYTTFQGTVYIPKDEITANSTYTLQVGSNARGVNTNPSKILPTSEAGKVKLTTYEAKFQINAPVAPTAATDPIGTARDENDLDSEDRDTPKIIDKTSNNNLLTQGMNDVVTLFSLWKQLSGYPLQKTDGTSLETIFHAIFSDETVSTLNNGENYTAPVFTTTPEYDYCGNVIGYKTEFVQGSIETSDTTKATQLDSLVSIPPTVKSVTPAVSATGVFTDVTIKIIFSQDMDSVSFTTRDIKTTWKPTKIYDAFTGGSWPTGATATNTVEYEGAEYSSNANNNTNNLPTDTTYWTKRQDAHPTSGNSIDHNLGPTGPGTGTVRLYNNTTSKYLLDISIAYNANNRTLNIAPKTALLASNQYTVVIIGTSGSVTAKCDPVENNSGVPLESNFSSSFTINAGGNTEASAVFSQSAGGAIKFPNYTYSGLGSLANGLTATDSGATAFCLDCTNGSGVPKEEIVYWTGTQWKHVSDGQVISNQ